MAEALTLLRGDIVTAVPHGEYGKPRPCVIVQSNKAKTSDSITLCPMTGYIRDDVPLFRLTIAPEAGNGLQKPSQIAIDKLMTLPISRIGKRVGSLSDEQMLEITQALAIFLEIH